jgi:hypothetical protein
VEKTPPLRPEVWGAESIALAGAVVVLTVNVSIAVVVLAVIATEVGLKLQLALLGSVPQLKLTVPV